MANIFSVQKHDASHLHYDFRLEIGRVLKSWAIPKGPSTKPKDKRLAIETEDHDLSYANFEGVIEEGYGKGTVMLWDKGSYKLISKSGKEIKFVLKGKKLQGEWALVKMQGKNWLLIKKDDEFANKKVDEKSVKTGRTMKEIETGA